MKWRDACMNSDYRKAWRQDELGRHEIDVDGRYILFQRDPDIPREFTAAHADNFRDWEPM